MNVLSLSRSLAVAALILQMAGAHAQRIDWLTYTSSNGSNLRTFTAVDPFGNAIMAGEFSGSITVGGQTFGSLGPEDIILAKFDSSGSFIWGTLFASSSDEFINGLACDADGNIYIALHSSGFSTSFQAADTMLVLQSTTGRNLLCKVDPTGHLLKERRSEYGWSFDVTGYEVYAFSSYTLGTYVLEHMNVDLVVQDTIDLGTLEIAEVRVDVSPSGYIALAGQEYVADAMTVQGVPVPNEPTDNNEVIVACFAPGGSLQWITCSGSMNALNERARGIAVDDNGRVYVATGSDTSFTFAGANFPSIAGYDGRIGFLLAYDAAGNESWAAPAYTHFNQATFWDVIIDQNGDLLASADLVNGGLVNGQLVPAVQRPFGLLKLDTAGNTIWLKHPMAASIYMNCPMFNLGQGPDGSYYAGGFGRHYDMDCIDLPAVFGWTYYVMRIVDEPWDQPTADFIWNATGLDVQFTDASTNATAWSWDLGDATGSIAPSPFHAYGASGTYYVTLQTTFGLCTSVFVDTLTLLSTGTPMGDVAHDPLRIFATADGMHIQNHGGSTYTFDVRDMSGRTIARARIAPGSGRSITVPPGLYHATFVSDGADRSIRIVVQ